MVADWSGCTCQAMASHVKPIPFAAMSSHARNNDVGIFTLGKVGGIWPLVMNHEHFLMAITMAITE